MGFDAGEVLEPLDYDFTHFAHKDPCLATAKGTIEEPSDQAVQKMLSTLQATTKRLFPENVDTSTPAAMGAAMAQMPDDAFREAETAIIEAIAEVCGGSPSREQLVALPYRHKKKFVAWLQRQLMNPES